MISAVAAALPLALGLLIAALPVVLVPTALAAKRPPSLARAFAAGWFLAVLLVGGILIALVDVLVLPSGNATWFSYAKIVIGLLLIALAIRSWVTRTRASDDPTDQGLLAGAETMSAGRAFGIAALLASLNPKNLALVVAGATAITEATAAPAQQAVALLVFAVVGSLGVAAPAVITVVLGDRAPSVLATADTWLTRNSSVIVAAVLLVLGMVLALNGLSGLRSV